MKNKTMTQRPRAGTWREYNRSLCQRGSITVWIDPKAEELFATPEHDGSRGHPKFYGDGLILALGTLQQVFHLRLRQTIGMIESILALANIEHELPDFTTFWRRRNKLAIGLRRSSPKARGSSTAPPSAITVVIDSTGIKVLGQGEWITSRRGLRHYRQWRLLHLALNVETLEILAATDSSYHQRDHQQVDGLLDAIAEPVDTLIADGAYDRCLVYDRCAEQGIWPVIPPSKRARIWRHGNSSGPPHPRDVNLRSMRQQGRAAWRCFSGYHQRVMAETTMHRLKMIFGDRLQSRRQESQRAELLLRCRALNIMTALGLPPRAST
jgi:hypothetical protein